MIPDRAQFRDATRYLAAVASELARPALRAYARRHARRAPTSPHAWRTGVILGAGHLGDVLYRTCSLDALHAGLPNCRWTYLTTRAGAELLRGNPALADVIAADENGADVARQLAEHDFDVALCTDNIEHHASLLRVVRAGIPNRVAFGSKGLSGLTTIAVPVPRAPWPAQIRSMVSAVTGAPPTWPLRPRVYPTAADEREGAAAWDALPMADAPLTVALAVTSRQALGVAAPRVFERIVAELLAREPSAGIMLAGAPADRAVLDQLATEIGARAAVAPSVGVRAFVALLRRCDAFLGSDSGPRHMANAAGIPVFFTRNMAVPDIETGRYCDTEVDIAPPGQYLDAAETASSLDRIDAAAVAAALVRAMRARAC